MLLGFDLVNVMIAAYQESKTEHVLEALRDLTSPRALVIRDGAWNTSDADAAYRDAWTVHRRT
jgi:magnesium-transporting ATPase (P-type)